MHSTNVFWPFNGPEPWTAFVWFVLGASIPTLLVLLYFALRQWKLDRDTREYLKRIPDPQQEHTQQHSKEPLSWTNIES